MPIHNSFKFKKNCKNCGRSFSTGFENIELCSAKCIKEWAEETQAEKLAEQGFIKNKGTWRKWHGKLRK